MNYKNDSQSNEPYKLLLGANRNLMPIKICKLNAKRKVDSILSGKTEFSCQLKSEIESFINSITGGWDISYSKVVSNYKNILKNTTDISKEMNIRVSIFINLEYELLYKGSKLNKLNIMYSQLCDIQVDQMIQELSDSNSEVEIAAAESIKDIREITRILLIEQIHKLGKAASGRKLDEMPSDISDEAAMLLIIFELTPIVKDIFLNAISEEDRLLAIDNALESSYLSIEDRIRGQPRLTVDGYSVLYKIIRAIFNEFEGELLSKIIINLPANELVNICVYPCAANERSLQAILNEVLTNNAALILPFLSETMMIHLSTRPINTKLARMYLYNLYMIYNHVHNTSDISLSDLLQLCINDGINVLDSIRFMNLFRLFSSKYRLNFLNQLRLDQLDFSREFLESFISSIEICMDKYLLNNINNIKQDSLNSLALCLHKEGFDTQYSMINYSSFGLDKTPELLKYAFLRSHIDTYKDKKIGQGSYIIK